MIDLPDAAGLVVALDTEASGLFVDDGARVSVVSLAWRDGGSIQELVLPFDQGCDSPLGPKATPKRYPGPALFDEPAPNLGMDEWLHLRHWLGRQHLVYHNSKYDQHIMRAGLRGHPQSGAMLGRRYLWDTMVVAPLIWPNQSAGLKPIAERLWGLQETVAEKAMRNWLDVTFGKRGDRRYDLAPWQIMEPYAAQDAALTLRLYEYQQELLEEGQLVGPVVDREIDLAQVLYRMEVRGVGYDVEAAQEADRTCQRLVTGARSLVTGATGINDPTENRMRVFWFNRDTGKTHVRSVTKEGAAQVTVAVVRDLADEGVVGAKEWAEYARLETAQSMWYGNWWRLVGDDGRLRTSYWQTKTQDERRGGMRGTVSGRLAVERVQLQAIPHDYQIPPGLPPVRSFFRARPGHIVVEIDMSQCEVRVAAGITKCRGLLEGFDRGDDAHSIACRETFKIEPDDELWPRYRAVAKRLVLGMLYGAGLDVLVDQIVLFTGMRPNKSEVQRWRDAFKQAMPELDHGAYMAKLQADKVGFVDVPGGKRRYFAFGEPTHKAFNARIQGGVATLMADAMIAIEVRHPGCQIAQIHDSIWLEVPEDDVGREIVRDCRQLMVVAFERHIKAPFTTDAKVFARAQ